MTKIESSTLSEALAIQQFSEHVKSCERSNNDRSAGQRAFRREMRGYGVALVTLTLGGLAFLLYNGLRFPGLH